jgi:serine/threonine protein kinase
MPLTAGSNVGPYEVVSLPGKGGMGEVYCAFDRNLRREVALKVLPDALASDAEHLSRFKREAQVLALLNHPNIAAIYGFEATSDVQALVLELVGGPTLAERLASGPVTVKEALAIAMQIADALDAAHQRSIIHRDLKPANIKITPDGRVKVLDFGIAKLMADAGYGAADVSNLPTMTEAGTRQGTLLGTPAYMSPEQTRGPSVDTRTDIWAFGCVLFEMLTGRPAFAAATVSDTIAKIIEREPAWPELPAQTPAAVHRLLQRCLEKDPRRRLHHMADIRIELEDAIKVLDTRRSRNNAAGTRAKRFPLKWVIAALTIAAASALTVSFLFKGSVSHRALSEDYIPLTNFTDSAVQPSLSPDGRMLTFIRGDDPFTTAGEVYVKLLPNGDPVQLTHDGHDGSAKMSPKFSPDGSRITYTKLMSGWET